MNASNTTVVVSRHHKDVSWTQKLTSHGYHVIVYDHHPHQKHPYFVSANNGREASVYLKYLTDYYDSLSTYTVFLQDEDYSWHHRGSVADLVLSREGKRSRYYNLNSKCLGIITTNELWPTMRKFFSRYLAPYIGSIETYGEFTPGIKCCAQFIVHCDKVRAFPRKMYADMLEYALKAPEPKTPNPAKARGHMLEWTWHLLFDNPVLEVKDGSSSFVTNDNKNKKNNQVNRDQAARFREKMEARKHSLRAQHAKQEGDGRRKAHLRDCPVI